MSYKQDYSILPKNGSTKSDICNEYGIKVEITEPSEQLNCKFCNYSAKQKNALKVHNEMNHINLRYLCNLCDYSTKEKYTVRKHQKITHVQDQSEDLIYQCGICNDNMRVPGEIFIKHIKQNHSEYYYIYAAVQRRRMVKSQPQLTCEYCNANFDSNQLTKKHIDGVHMRLMYQCNFCEFCCKKIDMIKKHRRKHQPLDQTSDETFSYQCSFCPSRQSSYEKILSHFKLNHIDKANEKLMSCQFCKNVWGTDKFLARHNREVHKKLDKVKQYICQVCNFPSAWKDKLKIHYEAHYKPKFSCQICDANYHTRVLMAEHIKMEHRYYFDWWRQFARAVCAIDGCCFEAGFLEYDTHLEIEHMKTIPRKLTSNVQSLEAQKRKEEKRKRKINAAEKKKKEIPLKRKYLKYIKSKEGQDPMELFQFVKADPSDRTFHCTLCDYVRKTKHETRNHVESIHFPGKYSYPCDQCELVFTTKITICHHRSRIHNFGKKMSIILCNLCDYQSKRRNDLKEHKLSMHESLRYPCDQCEFQTTSNTCLQLHKKGNHLGIKYTCTLCDYQTGWAPNLRRHKETKHAIANTEKKASFQGTLPT